MGFEKNDTGVDAIGIASKGVIRERTSYGSAIKTHYFLSPYCTVILTISCITWPIRLGFFLFFFMFNTLKMISPYDLHFLGCVGIRRLASTKIGTRYIH